MKGGGEEGSFFSSTPQSHTDAQPPLVFGLLAKNACKRPSDAEQRNPYLREFELNVAKTRSIHLQAPESAAACCVHSANIASALAFASCLERSSPDV